MVSLLQTMLFVALLSSLPGEKKKKTAHVNTDSYWLFPPRRVEASQWHASKHPAASNHWAKWRLRDPGAPMKLVPLRGRKASRATAYGCMSLQLNRVSITNDITKFRAGRCVPLSGCWSQVKTHTPKEDCSPVCLLDPAALDAHVPVQNLPVL